MLRFSYAVVRLRFGETHTTQTAAITRWGILVTPDFESFFPLVIRARQINQCSVDLNKLPLEEWFADDSPCKSRICWCHISKKWFLFLQSERTSYRWQVPIAACSWPVAGALLEWCVRQKLLGVLVLKSKCAAENNKCTYVSEIQIGGICLKTRRHIVV